MAGSDKKDNIMNDISNPNRIVYRGDLAKKREGRKPREKYGRVRICPRCKWQWEGHITSGYYTSHGARQVRYEPNTLPTYGKERLLCGECTANDKKEAQEAEYGG
jgi:hypothetical protein